MAYRPGHDAIVMAVNETVDPLTLTTTLGTNPTFTPATDIIGYCDVPEITHEEGGRKGSGIGSPFALYNGKGRRMENLSFNIKITSLAFLNKCRRNGAGVQRIAIAMAQPGVATRVYRFCQCNQFTLSVNEEGDSEITATAQFMCIGYKAGTTITQPAYSVLAAPGNPLYFHNVANLMLGGIDYRDAFMSLSATYSNNLEVKGIRYDMGDNNELSRRPFDFLPHNVTVTGELALHSDLPAALFTAAVNSTSWGDILLAADDTPATPVEITPKAWDITFLDVIPASSRQAAVAVGQQMNFSASFLATDLVIADAA